MMDTRYDAMQTPFILVQAAHHPEFPATDGDRLLVVQELMGGAWLNADTANAFADIP